MNCLDSSFLIDYLNGSPGAKAYLTDRPAGSFYTPTLVLFELYDGLDEYTDHDLDEFDRMIDWVTPLPFTAGSAREAIKIMGELAANGTPINRTDVLIAGTIREVGGTIVTRYSQFRHVDGLTVESY